MYRKFTRDAYRIGFLWSAALWFLLSTITTWYIRGSVPVAHINLTIFLSWLVFVPVASLYLDTRYR